MNSVIQDPEVQSVNRGGSKKSFSIAIHSCKDLNLDQGTDKQKIHCLVSYGPHTLRTASGASVTSETGAVRVGSLLSFPLVPSANLEISILNSDAVFARGTLSKHQLSSPVTQFAGELQLCPSGVLKYNVEVSSDPVLTPSVQKLTTDRDSPTQRHCGSSNGSAMTSNQVQIPDHTRFAQTNKHQLQPTLVYTYAPGVPQPSQLGMSGNEPCRRLLEPGMNAASLPSFGGSSIINQHPYYGNVVQPSFALSSPHRVGRDFSFEYQPVGSPHPMGETSMALSHPVALPQLPTTEANENLATFSGRRSSKAYEGDALMALPPGSHLGHTRSLSTVKSAPYSNGYSVLSQAPQPLMTVSPVLQPFQGESSHLGDGSGENYYEGNNGSRKSSGAMYTGGDPRNSAHQQKYSQSAKPPTNPVGFQSSLGSNLCGSSRFDDPANGSHHRVKSSPSVTVGCYRYAQDGAQNDPGSRSDMLQQSSPIQQSSVFTRSVYPVDSGGILSSPMRSSMAGPQATHAVGGYLRSSPLATTEVYPAPRRIITSDMAADMRVRKAIISRPMVQNNVAACSPPPLHYDLQNGLLSFLGLDTRCSTAIPDSAIDLQSVQSSPFFIHDAIALSIQTDSLNSTGGICVRSLQFAVLAPGKKPEGQEPPVVLCKVQLSALGRSLAEARMKATDLDMRAVIALPLHANEMRELEGNQDPKEASQLNDLQVVAMGADGTHLGGRIIRGWNLFALLDAQANGTASGILELPVLRAKKNNSNSDSQPAATVSIKLKLKLIPYLHVNTPLVQVCSDTPLKCVVESLVNRETESLKRSGSGGTPMLADFLATLSTNIQRETSWQSVAISVQDFGSFADIVGSPGIFLKASFGTSLALKSKFVAKRNAKGPTFSFDLGLDKTIRLCLFRDSETGRETLCSGRIDIETASLAGMQTISGNAEMVDPNSLPAGHLGISLSFSSDKSETEGLKSGGKKQDQSTAPKGDASPRNTSHPTRNMIKSRELIAQDDSLWNKVKADCNSLRIYAGNIQNVSDSESIDPLSHYMRLLMDRYKLRSVSLKKPATTPHLSLRTAFTFPVDSRMFEKIDAKPILLQMCSRVIGAPVSEEDIIGHLRIDYSFLTEMLSTQSAIVHQGNETCICIATKTEPMLIGNMGVQTNIICPLVFEFSRISLTDATVVRIDADQDAHIPFISDSSSGDQTSSTDGLKSDGTKSSLRPSAYQVGASLEVKQRRKPGEDGSSPVFPHSMERTLSGNNMSICPSASSAVAPFNQPRADAEGMMTAPLGPLAHPSEMLNFRSFCLEIKPIYLADSIARVGFNATYFNHRGRSRVLVNSGEAEKSAFSAVFTFPTAFHPESGQAITTIVVKVINPAFPHGEDQRRVSCFPIELLQILNRALTADKPGQRDRPLKTGSDAFDSSENEIVSAENFYIYIDLTKSANTSTTMSLTPLQDTGEKFDAHLVCTAHFKTGSIPTARVIVQRRKGAVVDPPASDSDWSDCA